MRWFKYAEDIVAGAILGGNIRLTRLAKYSDSAVLGDAVGDADEATRTTHVDDFDSGPERAGEMFGGAIKMGRHTRIIDSTFRTTFTALYGFCASSEYSDVILTRFARENADAGLNPYDACVQIADHIEFREVLSAAAKAEGLNLVAYGCCVYARRTFSHREKLPAHPGMLKKMEHSWQQEVRLVFAAEPSDDLLDFVDLNVPNAKQILKKIPSVLQN